MNPNEPGNQGGVGLVADKPPVAPTEPSNPSVNPSLDSFGSVAQVEQATGIAAMPEEAPNLSPIDDFLNKFSTDQPQVVETKAANPPDSSTNTNDLLAKAQSAIEDFKPITEVAPKPETANEKLLRQIADIVNNYKVEDRVKEEVVV